MGCGSLFIVLRGADSQFRDSLGTIHGLAANSQSALDVLVFAFTGVQRYRIRYLSIDAVKDEHDGFHVTFTLDCTIKESLD
jgi:hypothetical protein